MQVSILPQWLPAQCRVHKVAAPRRYCARSSSPRHLRPRSSISSSSAASQGGAEVVKSAAKDAAPVAATPAEAPAAAAPPPEPEYDLVKQLRLQIGSANIPHPDKVSYGGEDAWFASDVGGGALGVADGVGGWADSEVNPAEYAKTFMLVAKFYLEGKDVRMNEVNGSVRLVPAAAPLDTFDGEGERTPQGALDAGHVATRLPGSTTACVLRLNRDANTISAANLGDSGFVLVRDGLITFRSPVLQHFFDCPLQFGAVPEHTNASDYAEDADLFELAVQPGDHIIAASDGLWDNARDEEVLGCLSRAGRGSVDQAADAIAQLARRNAGDDLYESPYSVEALRQGIDLSWWEKLKGARFSPQGGGFKLGKLQGGKMDDITVVVARVAEEEVKVPRPVPEAAESPESASKSEPEAEAPAAAEDSGSGAGEAAPAAAL